MKTNSASCSVHTFYSLLSPNLLREIWIPNCRYFICSDVPIKSTQTDHQKGDKRSKTPEYLSLANDTDLQGVLSRLKQQTYCQARVQTV